MMLTTLNEQMEAEEQMKTPNLIGTVIDNKDPDGLNRIKVRVPGLYEEGELPWVGIKRAVRFGASPNHGSFGTPVIGSTVVIELSNGDSNFPMCTGEIQTKPNANSMFSNGDHRGFKDPEGNVLFIGDGKFEFIHHSGTHIKVDGSGNIDVNGTQNQTVTLAGNMQITVNGNADINVSGPVNVTAPTAHLEVPETSMSGNLNVNGVATVGGLNLLGTAGTSTMTGSVHLNNLQASGDLTHAGGTIRSNDVTIDQHTHTNEGYDPPVAGT